MKLRLSKKNSVLLRFFVFSTILFYSNIPSAYSVQPVYPASNVITGITFDLSSRKTLAPGSDNWAITWADDDNQYTTWGDGGGFGGTNSNGRVSLGYAKVTGGKSNYSTSNVWGGANTSNGGDFNGKSLGIISIDGVIYTWRNGSGSTSGAFEQSKLYKSTDHLKNLNDTGVMFHNSEFSNNEGIFSPTFLQFGRDYQGARDNYVYIYAPENKSDVWNVQKPGEITLMRVKKTELTQKNKYQYFTGLNGTTPSWSSNLANRKPVFSDPANGVMRTSVSYNAGLGRYILITQQVNRYENKNAHIGIYDAPEPWGPWTTVLLEDAWSIGLQENGPKTVFWNFSNKWLSADGKQFVLVFTGVDEWATVEGTFQAQGGGSTSPPPSSTPVAPTGLTIQIQ